jgi:hypothetical protein
MNTRCFVSGSSLLLAGWLGATFLNEVPAQRYPKLDQKPAKLTALHAASEPCEVAAVVKTTALPLAN